MRKYSTIDYLSDLTPAERSNAIPLQFTKVSTDTNHKTGWDFQAAVNGDEDNALTHSIYSFKAYEGATYDIYSVSSFDPYLVKIFDEQGNTIEANLEQNDPADFNLGGVLHGVDKIAEWVAPYTGTYYVEAGWNQGTFNKFYSLSVNENMDTISSEPISAKAGRIFNWAEDEYSILFPNHPETEIISGFHARIYDSGAALGEKDGNMYFYDGAAGGSNSIILLGTVSDFLPQVLAEGF
jgi:hypothetical protein